MEKRSIRVIVILSIIAAVLSFGSCRKDIDMVAQELEIIENYLKKYDLDDKVPTESGMYYIETIEGTGAVPIAHDTVEVYYTGSFLSGEIFDSNHGSDPLVFPLGEGHVIPGWDEGLTYMKEGGHALLIIPSWMAYGQYGYNNIPGYSPLAFIVELEKVTPGPYH